jgi:hypothetical protein
MQSESFTINNYFTVFQNYLCSYWDIVNSFNPCNLSIADSILTKVKNNSGQDY